MPSVDLRVLDAEPVAYVGEQPTAFIDKDSKIWKPAIQEIKSVNTPEVRAGMRGHRMMDVPAVDPELTKLLTGIGGAPTRATTLPADPKERKKHPVASGVLDYFPDALVAIAAVSYAGNEQHNPGKPLHWDRSKSGDEADTLIRHFLERGTLDKDGHRHSAKMAWRALALLQKEIEEERK
jgi:dATP/dGTP diphosphohydrolase, N-terminal